MLEYLGFHLSFAHRAEAVPSDPVGDTVVCGHTHMPFVRLAHGRLVINPGSIGMPYGRMTGAHWALLGPGVELRTTHSISRPQPSNSARTRPVPTSPNGPTTSSTLARPRPTPTTAQPSLHGTDATTVHDTRALAAAAAYGELQQDRGQVGGRGA